MSKDLISEGLDRDIADTHARFVTAMESRLPSLSIETKERYFSALNALVLKLETPDKDLREIMQEMMAEAATLMLQEMQANN